VGGATLVWYTSPLGWQGDFTAFMSAITVTFFSVVEPLTGTSFAFFSAGERLPMLAYIGGGIVIVGIVLQVMAGTRKKELIPALAAERYGR
jgi:drug/metabolite transporter (DMT)-like permease